MKASLIRYDIGATLDNQKLWLAYSRDTAGAIGWTIRKDASCQLDDDVVISGITDQTIMAMMEALDDQVRYRRG
jgi:hypothetical protein